MNLSKLFIILVVLFLAACAKDLPPSHYESGEVGKLKKVIPGVIISKRPIVIDTAKINTPVTIDDKPAEIRETKRTHGYEYVVKLSNGDIVSVAQDEDLRLKNKQHVLVIYGTNTRIVADEGSGD